MKNWMRMVAIGILSGINFLSVLVITTAMFDGVINVYFMYGSNSRHAYMYLLEDNQFPISIHAYIEVLYCFNQKGTLSY